MDPRADNDDDVASLSGSDDDGGGDDIMAVIRNKIKQDEAEWRDKENKLKDEKQKDMPQAPPPPKQQQQQSNGPRGTSGGGGVGGGQGSGVVVAAGKAPQPQSVPSPPPPRSVSSLGSVGLPPIHGTSSRPGSRTGVGSRGSALGGGGGVGGREEGTGRATWPMIAGHDSPLHIEPSTLEVNGTLDDASNIHQSLPAGGARGSGGGSAGGGAGMVRGRGLHSSTFQLNLSALYGIGDARRGCVARV